IAGGFQVLQLAREAERQSREPLHEGADRQVVSLAMRRAYRVTIGDSPDVLTPSAYYLVWIVLHAGVAVLLHDLAVADAGTESQVNCFGIGHKAIGADLRNVIVHPSRIELAGQADHEPPRRIARSLAKQMAGNQAGVLVLGRE